MTRYVMGLVVLLGLSGLGAGMAVASDDGAAVALLNANRAAQGLPPVQPHAQLMAAAQIHASDMARHGFMSHQGSDGSDLVTRIRRQGFCYRAANENVASGYPTAVQAMEGWFASRGHRRNALSDAVTHYGLARADRSWVLVMARPC